MRNTKLIKVMKVSQTEDERRHEDSAGKAGPGTEEQWNSSRTEKAFFSNRTLAKQLAYGLR